MRVHKFAFSVAAALLTASALFAADAPKKLLLVGQGPDGHPPRYWKSASRR